MHCYQRFRIPFNDDGTARSVVSLAQAWVPGVQCGSSYEGPVRHPCSGRSSWTLAFGPCRGPTQLRQARGRPHAALRLIVHIWSIRMTNLEAFAAANASNFQHPGGSRNVSTGRIALEQKRLQQLSVAIMFLRSGIGSVSSKARHQLQQPHQLATLRRRCLLRSVRGPPCHMCMGTICCHH